MSDRPILFSGPMVRALLAGTKSRTRRILKPQPETVGDKVHAIFKYAIGDRLWVRETLRYDWKSNLWRYDADQSPVIGNNGLSLVEPTPERWPLGVVTSIFMPRFASRLTLHIERLCVQRLQQITEEDAKAEGFAKPFVTIRDPETGEEDDWPVFLPPAGAFSEFWGRLHGPNAWSANPWVIALSFAVHKANIDASKKESA